MQHNPPQVLTVVAITCRQCNGSQSFLDNGESCHCHICENGYEKVMVPAMEFMMAVQIQLDDPVGYSDKDLHATIVRIAEAAAVRLPVLTHLTANLPVHLLPTKRRIPLAAAPTQTIPAKNAK